MNAQLQAAREAPGKAGGRSAEKAQEEAAKQASASTGNNTSGSSSIITALPNLLIPEVIITPGAVPVMESIIFLPVV